MTSLSLKQLKNLVRKRRKYQKNLKRNPRRKNPKRKHLKRKNPKRNRRKRVVVLSYQW